MLVLINNRQITSIKRNFDIKKYLKENIPTENEGFELIEAMCMMWKHTKGQKGNVRH